MDNYRGQNVFISPTAVVEPNCHIGNNVTIYDNVVIKSGTYIWDNVVIGKRPMGVSSNYRKLEEMVQSTIIGEKCVISCGAVIYAGSIIGNECLISEHTIIREKTFLEGENIIGGCTLVQYSCKIGKRTRILNGSIISSHSVIGTDNFISWGFMSVSDKAFGDNGYSENLVKGPVIGNNNNIGPNVTILDNLSIGDCNIIGAKALITKNIGSMGVYMGMPAKYIKERKL